MKSRSRKDRRRRAAEAEVRTPEAARPAAPTAWPAATVSEAAVEERNTDGFRFGRLYVPTAVLILVVAAALRLPLLAINPFHHDEGVNGFFLTRLVREGTYAYDPQNFHGPSLYYFGLASEMLFGLTDEALRLVPVICGLIAVALIFPLRRFIGPVATLTAAALLAVSPGAVYMSRYFIHESLLVCFSLALFVSALLYLDSRRPRFLVAAAAATALIFTTKETGVIGVAVFAIAAVVARFYVRWRHPSTSPGLSRRASRRRSLLVEGVEYRPVDESRLRIDPEQVVGASVIFVAIYVLLFSSFFSNFPQGIVDSLATFTIWTQTGQATQVQPIQTYLVWMLRAEAPILILGTIGGVIAAVRGRDPLWVVVGLWALGITAVYSIIQYKTPWIALNMLIPLALLAGLTIDTIARSVRLKRAAPVVVAAALAVAGYQSIDLNYRHYADETYPYVFVHTTPQAFELLDEIDRTAERAGTRLETGVVFVSPDYWPLPWYMRDYPRAGFFGSIVPTEEAMIVANVNQEKDLGQFADRYTRLRAYNLRPGVDLALYVRNDLATP
jgi:uncharacterized protein (TIGR03663 family)